jgi:hypothetical protein
MFSVKGWKECSSRLDRVELVKDSPATRHYWYLWDSLEITDELLLKQFPRKDGMESYNHGQDVFVTSWGNRQRT